MSADPFDIAAQPPCPTCGTSMIDDAGGYTCRGCDAWWAPFQITPPDP